MRGPILGTIGWRARLPTDNPGSAPRHLMFSSRRRSVALATVVALMVVAMTYDVVTLAAVDNAQASLRSTYRHVSADGAALSGVTAKLASASTRLHGLQGSESLTIEQLGSTDRSIDALDKTGAADSVDVQTLDTCLSGISDASAAIDAANSAGVLTAITAVSTTCLTLDGGTGGLAYPFNFPDPSVLRAGGEYFAFSTNAIAGNIQVAISSNLTERTPLGDTLPQLLAWAVPGNTWHPSVLEIGTSFVLYYAVQDGPTGVECVSEAFASQPQGPYVDSSSAPLICQRQYGGSLDPSPYVGADGRPYLVWKSQGADGTTPALWAQGLDAAGTALVAGQPSELLIPSQAWEAGIVEGPNMLVTGGHYLLFFGGNNWQTANYAIGVATCSGPLGPCTVSLANPVLKSDQSMQGPGGPSLFTDSGGNLWIAFHAWLPGEVGYPNGRSLFFRRVTLVGDAPHVEP